MTTNSIFQNSEIAYQALQFNVQPEFMDSSLFESTLEIAENLDLLFNKTRTLIMTQRDVPHVECRWVQKYYH